MKFFFDDTIAGIATAPGEGGVAIVRVSGADASALLCACFHGKQNMAAEEIPTRLMRYGHILAADGSVIDEAMAVLFRAPYSYTKEDVAEFHVHGGSFNAQKTLERLVELGARIAQPGEFTRRAFENGRIDLSQAEAVMDAIRADGKLASRAAQDQLSGSLRRMIEDFQSRLTMLLAKIDAAADYPDEDLDEETRVSCIAEFDTLCTEMDTLLSDASQARHIRDGVATAIFGAPNAGKSSVLNLLLGSDRAIVTPIAGTTRDTLEERLVLRGLVFRLIDTAGIRETSDTVEAIGVDRARNSVEQADILVFVIDSGNRADFDAKILKSVPKDKPLLVLLNKSDLETEVTNKDILQAASHAKILSICAKTGEGGQELKDLLYQTALGKTGGSSSQLLLGNMRHVHALKEAYQILKRGSEAAQSGIPVDLLGVDVQQAWQVLGQITGNTCEEDVIDAIFANFCVGK